MTSAVMMLFAGMCVAATAQWAHAADNPPALFASPVITADTPGHAIAVDVDLRGAKRLYLVATDAGDGITCDFADWADPRIVTRTGEIDLRELKWQAAETSWGTIRIDANAENGPLRIGGVKKRGIGTHANSLLAFRLPPDALRFRALAGLDTQGTDEPGGSTVQFFVYTEKPALKIRHRGPGRPVTSQPLDPVAEFSSKKFGQSAHDLTGRPTPVANLRLLEGFRAELLYTVPLQRQGSWVSLAVDPRGRLLASDQFKGLYRITIADPPHVDTPVRVERLNVDLGGAQGLLCAFGSLYAVVNGHGSGLYRLRDTNGDDQYDEVKLLRRVDGAGEHGPHAVVLGPDGKSLYINGGNSCFPERPPERSRVPRVWAEDRLQHRMGASDGPWGDGRIGAWVCRTDPDGRQLELVAMGMRNPYDIAFDRAGELFTFDADMEWDTGTPWYRPTRVNHIISGADFGWRAGTAKWPADYFDSFGSVVDVGLSSPTGVTFGYAARFPAKYRQAFIMGDWSLGNIYAVHLRADGASYTGEFESLVAGAPLPVTDLVINPKDGALYFVTGGRNIMSGLYRVTYAGKERLFGKEAVDRRDNAAVNVRRQLERGHADPTAVTLSQLWPRLADPDRAIRFAARVALEHQTTNAWAERALHETEPRIAIAALLALARHAEHAMAPRIVTALARIDWEQLTPGDRLDLLRTYMVTLSRHGHGTAGTPLRDSARTELQHRFPNDDDRLNRELAEILVFVDAPHIITRILEQLERTPTQQRQIHYVMCLRDVHEGWTLAERRRLFQWFQRSVTQRGGFLFGDYLDQIRTAIESQLTHAERTRLADVLKMPAPTDPLEQLETRPVVKQWTMDDVLGIPAVRRTPAVLDQGQRVFATALCYRCHRFAGQGGMVGPDLTNVARRLNVHDLVEAIVDPDCVISDQYRAVQILSDDGHVVSGKITDISGNTLVIMNDPFDQSDLSMVQRDAIDQMQWSKTSPMPRGLLDTFSAGEIAALLAFMRMPTP